MHDLNENSTFTFKGESHTVESFKEKFLKEAEKPYALQIAKMLQTKGQVKIIDNVSEERKIIEKAALENLIKETADRFEEQVESQKDAKANLRRQNKLTYKKIKLQFTSPQEATNAKNYIMENLRLKDIQITYEEPMFLLTVSNVTERDLSAINRYYTAGKLTGAVISGAEKGLNAVTGSIDYTAKNIITPIADIGVKGIGKIFATMSGILAHTGASLVTSTTEGVKRTKEEIINDPEMLKAARDLIDTKDTVKRKWANRSNSFSGIIIENQE